MSSETNLLIIVAVLTIFVSIILAVFLVKVKTEHKLSNRLFAIFLVLTAVDVSGILVNLLDERFLNLIMCLNLMIFLQLPVFYLYVLSVCFYDFTLKKKHLIHLIPFITVNLILAPRFYGVDLTSKISFLQVSSNMLETQLTHMLLHIQVFAYIIAVFMILRRAKKIYLENYTGASIESIHWLYQFTVALSVFYTIALVKNIFKFTEYTNISELLKGGLFIFELCIISWYLFKALNNPNLFRKIDSKLTLVKEYISEEKKKESTSNKNEFNTELLKLKTYMLEEKPFLNPSLTIQDIANDIKIPSRELSLLINHKLEQHFFDFINTYRIESAMAILKDPSKSKITILEILYEVGFNSKSSFNTAFKKYTGMTPTQYRKTAMI